jgi:SNF2 family DNA or RNA helicase
MLESCSLADGSRWKAEIESKTTPGLLNVVIHHGSTRSKSSNTIKQADVVLTTYGTLVSEFGKEDKPKQKQMYHSDNESEEVIFRRKGIFIVG